MMKIYKESTLDYVRELTPQCEYPNRIKYWENQIIKGHNKPIIVDKKNIYRIIDGNHTLQAYKNLNRLDRVQVYAVNRVDFLNSAAEMGELEWLEQAIKSKEATRIV